MGTAITFEWDSRALSIWRSGKVEAGLSRALRLAGNGAIRGMRKNSAGYIRSRKALKDKDVLEGMVIVTPGSRQQINDLLWQLRISSAPVPLSKFPHSDTRRAGRVRTRGVLVQINVGHVTAIATAFVAKMASGHEGIYQRRGKARLPIDELWSSRLSDTMRDPGAINVVQDKARAHLQKAFTKGLDREIKKLRRTGTI